MHREQVRRQPGVGGQTVSQEAGRQSGRQAGKNEDVSKQDSGRENTKVVEVGEYGVGIQEY